VCAGALGIADSQQNLEKNGEFASFMRQTSSSTNTN
jgi:hypothetical protein